MISVLAPAKVNLRLRVLAREESGYHSLETVFCAISLADELRVARTDPGVSLEVLGEAPTTSAAENLATRAVREFLRETGADHGARIRLVKRIPAAAGLGGGSSDAAAALRAMEALQPDPVDKSISLRIGAGLGSDVPFFLCGSSLALGWGRGDSLLALPPLPSRPVLVAHPRRPFPTADAFRSLAAARPRGFSPAPARLALEDLESWETIAKLATNDFEAPATSAIPELRDALSDLRDAGALVAMLAGSGAAVFGVFEGTSVLESVETELGRKGFDTWRAHTLEAMPRATGSPAVGAEPG